MHFSRQIEFSSNCVKVSSTSPCVGHFVLLVEEKKLELWLENLSKVRSKNGPKTSPDPPETPPEMVPGIPDDLKMLVRPWNFFWKNFCKFWVRAENFSATPHPQPQFSATEISAIPHFWPKTPFWGLLRSCSTWKWHQHHENCFGFTFWYFW